jgi:hypothetical protein
MDANDVNLFLDVPFGQRWECHKGTIHDLYIVQGRLIDDVAATMKARYKFDAK